MVIICVGLFLATAAALASHQLASINAIFLLSGSPLAALMYALRYEFEKEPWPLSITRPQPEEVTARPRIADWLGLWRGSPEQV
jgi:hypothetical protein